MRDGHSVSIIADENGTLYCGTCSAVFEIEDCMLLIKTKFTGSYQPFCKDCSALFLTAALRGGLGEIPLKVVFT